MNNEKQFDNLHLILAREKDGEANQKSFIQQMKISHISEENQKYQEQEYEQIYDTISQNSNPFEQDVHQKGQILQISSIFRHLQNPVQYETMLLEEICIQKQMLQDHIKFINLELNRMMRKKISRVSDGLVAKMHKGNKNNSRLKCNEWDDAGIQLQINNNNKLLTILRDQYSFLTHKLNKIVKPDFNKKYQYKIRQISNSINQMKQFLSQRNRKNVMNAKKIKNYDKKQAYKILFDCQQEYVKLSKKKEQYENKLNKMAEDNAKVIQMHSKVENSYSQLKKQAVQMIKAVPITVQSDHNKIIYDTRCRKLQLCLKKGQREEQDYKRKYYNLLKQYENKINAIKGLDEKLDKLLLIIENRREQIDLTSKITSRHGKTPQHNYRLWKEEQNKNLQQQSDNNSENSSANHNDRSGFLLTQISHDKSFQQKKSPNDPTKLKYHTQPNQERFKRSYSDANNRHQPKKLLPLNFHGNKNEGKHRESQKSQFSTKNQIIKNREANISFLQIQMIQNKFQGHSTKREQKDLHQQQTQRRAEKKETNYLWGEQKVVKSINQPTTNIAKN